jgi:hypothetical protein
MASFYVNPPIALSPLLFSLNFCQSMPILWSDGVSPADWPVNAAAGVPGCEGPATPVFSGFQFLSPD